MIYFYVKTFLGYRKGKTSEANFFFAFSSLIPFLYLLPKSYANKLEANWPAFAFVGLMYILVYMYSKNWHKKWIRWCYFGSNCFSFIVMMLLMVHTVFYVFPIPSKIDITNRYHKFEAIKNEFKTYYEKKWIVTLVSMSLSITIGCKFFNGLASSSYIQ